MELIPEISVIMPVYNARNYVKNAISSVLNQNFRDFELILIVDGASDGSEKICDAFAKNDERVVVVRQKNAGTSSARNRGLSVARGKYVTFCDHDDELTPETFERNYSLIEKYNADMLCFAVKYIYETTEGIVTKTLSSPFKVYEPKNVFEFVNDIKNENNVLFGYVWNHLYRRDVIRGIKFNDVFKHGHEDVVFNICVMKNIKQRIVFNGDNFYIHYHRKNSSGNSFCRDVDEVLINELLLYLHYEYEFAHSLIDFPIKKGGQNLIATLYMLRYRCDFTNKRQLKPFRESDFVKKYPLQLNFKEKIVLWSFRNSYPLFKVFYKLQLGYSDPGIKTISLNNRASKFWETSSCGFLYNIYSTRKGKIYFQVLDFLVKTTTFPFKLFK